MSDISRGKYKKNKASATGEKTGAGRRIAGWCAGNYPYLMAFFLAALLFIIVCIWYKVTPFGGKTLMIIDSLHQYLPFFSEYYDKLKEGGGFLYSWNGAGGYNFLTLWAYYLSSPFNLLILLFPKVHINTAMTLIIGLKICLCSVTMTYLLTHISGFRDYRASFFGLCYAFSNYIIGYYWNIMWLDVIMLTPLVILGLKRIIEEKDCRLYIVTLFMSLFCNFYVTFMLCIFLILLFFIYPHKNVKSFFISGLKFLFSSLLAAGMAAVILIPTYVGIMLTGPAESTFPKFSWYTGIVEIIKKFAIFSKSITNSNDDSGVNLYCSMLAIFLVILFFCLKNVSLAQKIKHGLLIVLLIVSCDNKLLNYIWHGFHDQFGIPNRFTYLLILEILVLSYITLVNVDQLSFWHYFVPMAFLVAVMVYNNEFSSLFDDPKVMRTVLGLMVGYYVIFMLYIILEWKPRVLYIVLGVVLTAEVYANAIYSFEGNGQITINDYFKDSNRLWAAAKSVDDGSFYREELSRNVLVDENFWQNLKSIGVFCSTANGDAVNLYNRMGFYTAANEHLYDGATPFTDSLLGVRYLYKRAGDYYDHGFDLKKTVDDVDIYENHDALSIGYMVDDDVEDWDYNQYQPADNLNGLARAMSGVKGDMFTRIPDDFTCDGGNCSVSSNGTGDGTYAYSRTAEGDLTVNLYLKAPDDRPIYLRATGTNLSTVDIYVNGELTSSGRYFFQLAYAGKTSPGDDVQVTYHFNGSEDDNQTVNLMAYSYDSSVCRQTLDAVSGQQLHVTGYSSNDIRGTIDAKNDGLFMTTVIDEPGWHIYVDGEEQDIYDIGGSFIGTELTKGRHDIRLHFVPQSLPASAAVSLGSVVIFILYLIFRKRTGDIVSKVRQRRQSEHEG